MRVGHVRILPILLLWLHLLGHASWHANNKGMLLMHLHHPWDIGAHCAMCMVRVVSAFDVLCSSQRRRQTQGHGPAQAMAYGHARKISVGVKLGVHINASHLLAPGQKLRLRTNETLDSITHEHPR